MSYHVYVGYGKFNLRQNCCDKIEIAYLFHSELKTSLPPCPMFIKTLSFVYRNVRYTENNIDRG